MEWEFKLLRCEKVFGHHRWNESLDYNTKGQLCFGSIEFEVLKPKPSAHEPQHLGPACDGASALKLRLVFVSVTRGNRTEKGDCVHFEQLPEFKSCRFKMYFLMRPSELLTPGTAFCIAWLKAFQPFLHTWWMEKRGRCVKGFSLVSFIFGKLLCWCFQIHISGKLFPHPRTGYLYGIKLLIQQSCMTHLQLHNMSREECS